MSALKRKNLKPICNRPLVSYVASELKMVRNVDRCFINTESEKIAAVGRDIGIDIYMRDPRLAFSSTRTDEIVIDFIDNNPCDAVLVVNPTAPLLKAATIERFVDVFKSGKPDSLFSCTSVKRHAIFENSPLISLLMAKVRVRRILNRYGS